MAKILIIDDEEDIRIILQHLLEGAGHQVVVAADGREGLRTWRSVPVDLVITDLLMPGMDGLELIQDMRRQRPQSKIIVMSGCERRGKENLLEAATSLGALRVLAKPFDLKVLLQAVQESLMDPLNNGPAASAC